MPLLPSKLALIGYQHQVHLIEVLCSPLGKKSWPKITLQGLAVGVGGDFCSYYLDGRGEAAWSNA